MIRFNQHVKQLLLAVGDYAVFCLSLLLALSFRYGGLTGAMWDIHAGPFSIIFLLWLAGFYVAGLYNLRHVRDPLKLFRNYTEGMVGNLLIAFAFFYLHPGLGIAPRTNLLVVVALTLLLGYIWRLLFLRVIDGRLFQGKVLYIGPCEDAAKVQTLLASSSLGLTLGSVLCTSGTPDERLNVQWIQDPKALEHSFHEQQTTLIVLGTSIEDISSMHDTLYRSLFRAITLIDRTELEESTTGRIPLTHVNNTWFIQNLRESEKSWYDSFKRVFDLILTVPFVLFTILIFPFVALAIKLSRTNSGKRALHLWNP